MRAFEFWSNDHHHECRPSPADGERLIVAWMRRFAAALPGRARVVDFWRRAGHVVLTLFSIAMLLIGLMQLRSAQASETQASETQSGAAQPGAARAHVAARAPTIALHYGAEPPLDSLRAFDVVVVDPGHGIDPRDYASRNAGRSSLYAYVSIGELAPQHPLERDMPAAMLLGVNPVWGSRIIDQTHPDWPRFFVEQVITPLWSEGYRGFFIDTMDSYQAVSTRPEILSAQQDGLVKALQSLKSRYPDARLIANRGFELLPRIRGLLDVIAAESLFGRWDAAARRYVEVPAADREWLLGQFERARAMGLPTVAIDYVDPADPQARERTAAQILATGAMPWVTDGDLTGMGVGSIAVAPRAVLLVHNGTQMGDQQFSSAQSMLAMPLNYLGYRVELIDTDQQPLPRGPLAGQYAGIIGAFEQDLREPELADWVDLLKRARAQAVPIAIFNGFGAPLDSGIASALDIAAPAREPLAPLAIAAERRPLTSFELPALPSIDSPGVRPPAGSDVFVRVRDARGDESAGAAFTPWGGFALLPFSYKTHDEGMSWIVDPIAFLRRVLHHDGSPPIPDVTTESGRRLLMVHIDGDGFASRAEIPGSPYAAEVMLHDFIARYPVPHTVSVIEGEIAPHGLYPNASPALEKIARQIFKLDHVEIATHTWSHPFFWNAVVAAANEAPEQGRNAVASARAVEGAGAGLAKGRKMHLPLTDYRFSLDRETAGSAKYIDERLAPPGKRTKVLLWTGDCVPPAEAIRSATRAGLLNMNGGDTVITRQNPSLSRVAALSIRKEGALQVYAPNQNENVYTNDWLGPYYGFEKVIETFEMTERPLRLKPINIYYHTYSASKHSAIRALHAVYRYALSQPVAPVYGSEYIRKVHDFESIVFAREIGSDAASPVWRIRTGDDLRTVRIPSADAARIDWRRSQGVAGVAHGADGDYLHLAASDARLVLRPGSAAQRGSTASEPSPPPIVESANGRIDAFERIGRGSGDPGRDGAAHDSVRFRFSSHVPGELRLLHSSACQVRANGKRLKPASSARAVGSPDALNADDDRRLYRYTTGQSHAAPGILVSIDC